MRRQWFSADNLSKRANRSLRTLTNSWALHWLARAGEGKKIVLFLDRIFFYKLKYIKNNVYLWILWYRQTVCLRFRNDECKCDEIDSGWMKTYHHGLFLALYRESFPWLRNPVVLKKKNNNNTFSIRSVGKFN